jgi:hypothetical protein
VANPNSQFSPNLQNRYTNTQRSRHTKFDLGMIRDVASWELPEGACFDTVDTLCDYVGKIRKRGGTTSPASGNSTATVENLLSYRSRGVDGLTGIWGALGKAGVQIISIDRTTGASTTVINVGSAAIAVNRPFQHENIMPFSFQALGTTAADRNVLYYVGGSTTSVVGGTNAVATAGSNLVTVSSGMSAGCVGQIFAMTGSLGSGIAGEAYAGRIVSFISATQFRIEPTPRYTFQAANDWVSTPGWDPNSASPPFANIDPITGRYGVSFQGRMVLGYTLRTTNATLATSGLDVKPNRLAWTQAETEPISGGTYYDGNPLLYPQAFNGNLSAGDAYYNYVDIPSLGGMTGLAAVGDGQLVIFGPRSIFRLSGQLTTDTVQNNAFSWSVDQISNNVGIPAKTTFGIDDPSRSIQYAQNGVLFAGTNSIYLYDGASMKPLLQGRNARYYQDRLRAGDVIYGSAYSLPKNHYYLSMSGSDGGLMIELDTNAMTRMSGPTMQLFDAVPDPANATKLWGIRWWDRTGAAPTMTKGQLIQIDPIWAPTSANKNDADGTAVLSLTKSAAYVDGALPSNKMTADLNITADIRGSGSPTATVKADTKLNVSDASFTTIGTVPAGTAAGSKSFPVGYLVPEGPAIEIQFGNDVACDSCELLGLDFGTQGRPEEFST